MQGGCGNRIDNCKLLGLTASGTGNGIGYGLSAGLLACWPAGLHPHFFPLPFSSHPSTLPQDLSIASPDHAIQLIFTSFISTQSKCLDISLNVLETKRRLDPIWIRTKSQSPHHYALLLLSHSPEQSTTTTTTPHFKQN